MKYFLLIFSFILFSCEESSSPTYDPTCSIIGKIVTQADGELLDSVIVGFKNPSFPDSLLFVNDSLITSIENSIDLQELFPDGYFEFGFAFVAEPPVSVENMFAYKNGKKVWRFTAGVDTVYSLISNIDSLNIKMISR